MKISVIIPVYNKIRYLNKLLEQLCAQTFCDFECLLIDDGSTDGSGKVCDEFAAKDSRMRVSHIPNGGVSNARNVGLNHARGEYITFIDADDEIHPNYLKNLLCCAEKSGADLIISGYQKTDSQGNVLLTVIPEHKGLFAFQDILPLFAQEQKKTGLYGCCVSKIFSREFVGRIRFDERLRLAEDFDFYLKLYEKAATLYFDDHAWYYYLQDAENSTAGTASEKIDYVSQLKIWLRCRTMLQKRFSYNGSNMEIVEEKLNSYIYFALFYCPTERYRTVFAEVYALCRKENIIPRGCTAVQKWLLYWLRHNVCAIPKETMRVYRFLQKMLRKGL